MTEEQIKQKAGKYCNFYYPNTKSINMIDACIGFATEVTKELQEEIKKTQHLADVRCDQAVENYQKWHVTNREKIDLEIKVEELEKQIEKLKQDLDNARENANKQEQWEIYSVLNDIYNDNFEVITSVSN